MLRLFPLQQRFYRCSLLTLALAGPLAACGKAATTTGQTATASSGNAAAAAARTLTLTWDARTGKAAESFHVYGSASLTAAEVPITVVAANATGFDPQHPSVTLLSTDSALQPFVGKTLCLAVSAVVSGLESGYSNLVCQTL